MRIMSGVTTVLVALGLMGARCALADNMFGADDPLATVVMPGNRLPSSIVAPFSPPGLSKRATHSSPKVFFVPAGSPELSDPMKTRP